MKRSAALLAALAIAAGASVSCKGGSTESSSSKVDVTYPSKPEVSELTKESCMEIMSGLANAMTNGDKQLAVDYTFPDRTLKAIRTTNGIDYLFGSKKNDITIKEVTSIEDAEQNEVVLLEKMYSLYTEFFEGCASDGLDLGDMTTGKLSADDLQKLMDRMTLIDTMSDTNYLMNAEVNVIVKIAEAKRVSMKITRNGAESEQEIVVFKPEGEEWNVTYGILG